MIKTIVVSGFPGVGKSHLFRENNGLVIMDSDSSKVSWLTEGVRHPDFPRNYIEHIKANMGKAHLILVSSHKVVRDALRESAVAYVLVYPDRQLKSEYIQRYRDRGSDDAFVQMIESRWDIFMAELEAETWPTHRVLHKGEYLGDVRRELVYPVICNGVCRSDADDYCGMHLSNEDCPACDTLRATGGAPRTQDRQ